MAREDEELIMKYSRYLTISGKHTDPDETLSLQIDISTLSKSEKIL